MTPVELDQLVAAVRDHLWLVVASLSINLVIRLSKTDAAVAWFPVNLRPKVRPAAALICGIGTGVVAGLSGKSWGAALVGGVVAGMMAITTHDVVVEGARNGRDIGIRKAAPMFGDPS